MTAARTTLAQHRNYVGSVEEAAGIAATDEHVLRAEELMDINDVVNQHADLLDGLVDSSTEELTTALRTRIDEINALLAEIGTTSTEATVTTWINGIEYELDPDYPDFDVWIPVKQTTITLSNASL